MKNNEKQLKAIRDKTLNKINLLKNTPYRRKLNSEGRVEFNKFVRQEKKINYKKFVLTRPDGLYYNFSRCRQLRELFQDLYLVLVIFHWKI